jgi:predicted aspartyl protease
MSTRFAFCCMVALMLAGGPAAADDVPGCQLSRYASLDIGTENTQRVIVPVTLDGQEIPFLVDTGAPTSMLTNATANKLALDRQMMVGIEVRMLNGARIHEEAVAPTFEIGGMKGTNFRFAILPNRFIEPPARGLLGADIVRNYDLDFDFAQNKLNLFARRHCVGQVVYWTHAPYAVLPFHFDEGHHMVVPVKLDGVSMMAIVDTGAPPAVLMSLPRARHDFGWQNDPPELHRVHGPHSPSTYPFSVLSLGGASVHQPSVELPDGTEGSGPDMFMGLDALKAFHVYISYEDRAIYLTARDAH